MLNLSKIHREVARFKYGNIPFPKTNEAIYWQYYFRLETYFQELIDDIFEKASNVSYPIGTEQIEEYLSGYSIIYHPFDNQALNKPELQGFWDCDPSCPFEIHILYNTTGTSIKKQRFTKIHESFHILQYLDPEFRIFIDEFVKYETLPYDMVAKLVESVTNQATAMYLVPKSELLTQYARVNNLQLLSEYFQVSRQSLVYRLKNVGMFVSV